MNTFEIWSEGYAATGQSAGAMYHGTARGETFKDACMSFAMSNPEFMSYFDKPSLAYWGCKLYPNQSDASRSFG
jgi:hypothetical protein